jgi:hypothetical protein
MADELIEDPVKLGYPDWGRGSIRERDWTFLKQAIIDYDVRSICEVGIGLSTLLMQQMVDTYIGYDSQKKHIEWMTTMVMPHVKLRWWDGINPFEFEWQYDMCFVDGPQGAMNRYPSFQSVMFKSKILAMHDTGYVWRDDWKFKLDPDEKYEPIINGGGLAIWVMKE